MLLSKNQIAEFFGKSRATVTSWIADGLPVADASGKAHLYASAAVADWLIAKAEKRATRQAPARSARELLDRLKAAEISQRIRKARGELVPVEKIAPALEREALAARATLLEMQSRLAPAIHDAVLGGATVEDVAALLDDDIRAALAILSQYDCNDDPQTDDERELDELLTETEGE